MSNNIVFDCIIYLVSRLFTLCRILYAFVFFQIDKPG